MKPGKILTRSSILLALVLTATAVGSPPQIPGTELRTYLPVVQYGDAAAHPKIILEFLAVQTNIFAWAWGASRASAGPGSAQFQEISITREIDELSPMIMQLVANGQQSMGATLIDGNVTLQMQVVSVSSYNVSGGGSTPTESFTFAFEQFTYGVDGAELCWDIQSNIQC